MKKRFPAALLLLFMLLCGCQKNRFPHSPAGKLYASGFCSGNSIYPRSRCFLHPAGHAFPQSAAHSSSRAHSARSSGPPA